MTVEKIRSELAAIDIPATETALAEAEAQRHRMLLTGDNNDVLAAEAEITCRRIDRDRAVARKAALETDLSAALEADRASAFRKRYDDAVRLADDAEKIIRNEYPSFALRIIDIAEREQQAELAIAAVNAEIVANGQALPAITSPSERIWGGTYLRKLRFADRLSLPETADNPAFGAAAEEVTMAAAVALAGVGQPPAVPVFQYR